LQSMGSEFCSSWPVAQVPFDASRLFQNPLLPNKSQHLLAAERFDPSSYRNKYRKAPLPPSVRKVKDAYLLDYEERCAAVPTVHLSANLSGVMTNDESLSNFLRSSKLLFNQYKLITLYFVKLENQLLKASLLGEFWKTRATSGNVDAWSRKVEDCKSIRRLSALLLELLDQTHPRAFLGGWFEATRTRTEPAAAASIKESARAGSVRLPIDFSKSDESLRRHWERAPMSSIPKLISKTSMSVGEWIKNVRPDLGSKYIRNSKRKHSSGKKETKGSGEHASAAAVRKLESAEPTVSRANAVDLDMVANPNA